MRSGAGQDLRDYVPQALSRVSGRPLHIDSGSVRSGLVGRVVIDEMAAWRGEPQGPPIVLVCSCHGYGGPHDDLVSSESHGPRGSDAGPAFAHAWLGLSTAAQAVESA